MEAAPARRRPWLVCVSSADNPSLVERWGAWFAGEVDVVGLRCARVPEPQALLDCRPHLGDAGEPLAVLVRAGDGHAGLRLSRALADVRGVALLELFVAGLDGSLAGSPQRRGLARATLARGTSQGHAASACGGRPLNHPITVFAGHSEVRRCARELAQWHEATRARCSVCLVPGPRLNFEECEHLLGARIRHRLLSAPGVEAVEERG